MTRINEGQDEEGEDEVEVDEVEEGEVGEKAEEDRGKENPAVVKCARRSLFLCLRLYLHLCYPCERFGRE